MLSDDKTYVIYMVLAVLLPIAPAYLLYRTLPSRAVVKGPFKGFNIQLSGAFGGYFLVLLIMQGFVLLRPKPPQLEPYRVEGRLTGVPQEAIEDLVKEIVVRPADRVSTPQGDFTLEIMARRDPITHELTFPYLIIQRDGYDSVVVSLGESTPNYEVECNRTRGLIKIKTAIALQKKDQAYNEGE